MSPSGSTSREPAALLVAARSIISYPTRVRERRTDTVARARSRSTQSTPSKFRTRHPREGRQPDHGVQPIGLDRSQEPGKFLRRPHRHFRSRPTRPIDVLGRVVGDHPLFHAQARAVRSTAWAEALAALPNPNAAEVVAQLCGDTPPKSMVWRVDAQQHRATPPTDQPPSSVAEPSAVPHEPKNELGVRVLLRLGASPERHDEGLAGDGGVKSVVWVHP